MNACVQIFIISCSKRKLFKKKKSPWNYFDKDCKMKKLIKEY